MTEQKRYDVKRLVVRNAAFDENGFSPDLMAHANDTRALANDGYKLHSIVPMQSPQNTLSFMEVWVRE